MLHLHDDIRSLYSDDDIRIKCRDNGDTYTNYLDYDDTRNIQL